MPATEWTITHSNAPQLIGCHIRVDGDCYQFLTPTNILCASSCGQTSLPTPPFEFPMFSSALGGSTVVNWYITVSSVTANEIKGTWSNAGFGDIGSDTWTAKKS